MTDKYQNKYRIASTRLPHWDYSAMGSYFITICTKDRENYFGEITGGRMNLSGIGKIVETEWLKTITIRPDMNLQLAEFVIMPNHFHGVIIIGENEYNRGIGGGCGDDGDDGRDAMHGVSTIVTTPFIVTPTNRFGPQSKNLASIVRGFKSSVTKNAHLIHADFQWQSRYYDHIIRDAESFERIRQYIVNNPLHWKEDHFNNSRTFGGEAFFP